MIIIVYFDVELGTEADLKNVYIFYMIMLPWPRHVESTFVVFDCT